MRLRFVGCGDAFGSGGRGTTCFHVTGDRVNFLIDCGASSLPALKRLILTHMSDDMLGRLDTLNHTPAHDGMIVEV